MNFFAIIDFIIVFIVFYLLVMIGRWFVLPHLKVFPNIPPQWLWTSIVGVIMYAFNAVFHYILIALVIIYILWLIIRFFVPNFPIPIRRILLRMPPFYPLQQAGVLPLMDSVRMILFSRIPVSERVINAGRSVGVFLGSSTMFILQKFGVNIPTIPGAQTTPTTTPPTAPEPITPQQQAQDREVREAYLQCIEESIIPVTPTMTDSEKRRNSLRNQNNTLICKIKQLGTYSRIVGAQTIT